MATEKALIRFRCYNCNKLLGTSASKAGRTTTCPNCKAELIVPEPDEPERSALAEATRGLVPNLDLDHGPTPSGDSTAESPRPRHDPSFSWEEIDTAIFQTPGGPAPIDLPISFAPPKPAAAPAEPEPASPPDETPTTTDVPVSPPPPPPAAPVAIETVPIVEDRPRRVRSGEVILSQAVITSWAAFMLLSLAVSFLAGVFVGHFVWTSR